MSDERRIAVVTSYDELIAALRARADELKVTRETLDAVTGLQSGYAGKLLAPVPIRQFGRVSLGPMLQAMGLAIVVIEDLSQFDKISARMVERSRPVVDADDGMPTIKKPKRRRFLNKNSEWGKLMSARRVLVQSPGKRRQIARKAARARWRKIKAQKPE